MHKHLIKQIIFVLLLVMNTRALAQQTEIITDPFRSKVKIEEEKIKDNSGIPFLILESDTLLIESTTTLHYSDLKGRFNEKVQQATLNSKPIPIREDGSFNIHFGFSAQTKTFIITAINSKNKIFRTQYKIISQKNRILNFASGFWRFNAGAGLTKLSYRQKNITAFDQWAITVKGSATYQIIPDQLNASMSTFFNLIPFASNSDAGYKVQYLGINARAGYALVKSPSPFRININGGFYFNTSFSTIGFANMYGPQLYPEFIYIFPNGNSLLLYGKFSPAISQAELFSIKNNREVAMGLHYSFPLNSINRMSVGVDLSQLSLSTTTDWATTNTYSLSTGVSF